MTRVSATLTTKGQITIPKTIRDTLALTDGDEVEFVLSKNNRVYIQKKESPFHDIALNLVETFLSSPTTVTIVGEAGAGKTHFCRTLIPRLGVERIGLMEAFDELIFDFKKMGKKVVKIEDYQQYQQRKNEIDILVVEEAHRYCHTPLLRVKDNIPKIFISQFSQPFRYYSQTAEDFVEETGIATDILVRIKSKKVLFIKRLQYDGDTVLEKTLYKG